MNGQIMALKEHVKARYRLSDLIRAQKNDKMTSNLSKWIRTGSKEKWDLEEDSYKILSQLYKDRKYLLYHTATKHCTVGFKVLNDVERADSKTAHIRKTDLVKLEYKLKILNTPCVESLNRWYGNFISAFRESVRAAKKRISKVWFDRSCYLLHAKVKKQWDFCRRQENTESLRVFACYKKCFKKLCQSKKQSHEKTKKELTLSVAESDKSQFWTILKTRKPPIAHCAVSSDTWFDHFDKLLKVPSSYNFYPENAEITGFHDYQTPLSEPIPEMSSEKKLAEITRVVANSPNKKSAGPDGITNET